MNIEGGGAVRVLDKPNATEFDKNESLGIQTAGYDKSQDTHGFCGMGMKSPIPEEEDVVPVSISTGSHHAGRIVSVGDVGTTATIDFTGRKETIATVVFSNELSYDPAKYAFDQDGPDKGSEVKRGSVEKPPSDV